MDAVYLDYAATTPVRDEVRGAMEPYASERFGNPSSLHRWGREAADALENARAGVAEALGARASEIHFVRGGTESDNLAVLGTCRALCGRGTRPSLVVSAIEHAAVLDAARHASEAGIAEVRTLAVSPEGELDVDAVARPGAGAVVVSAMWVNNETGMVLPIRALAEKAGAAGALVHSDASQAVGKVPVHLGSTPVDLLTATGHKIYGPKGMGILYVRTGTPIDPLLYGGGQERRLRPGTEDVAGAVGFATALRLAVQEQAREAERLSALRAELESRLGRELEGVRTNGGGAERAPHVASVAFGDVSDGRTLLMALDLEGVAVSGGSACASGSHEASHVISALYGRDDPYATVRYSLGRATTPDDVDRAVGATVEVVARMRGA